MSDEIPNKPVILIVHGAWHSPTHYERLLTTLKEGGYTTSCPLLPSFDAPPYIGMLDDAACIKAEINRLVEAKEEVIIVGHSYGAIVATQAWEAHFPRENRLARGLEGGVLGMLLVAGFVLLPGQSLGTALGGGFLPPWSPVDVSPYFNKPLVARCTSLNC